jgi:hypothetical protein
MRARGPNARDTNTRADGSDSLDETPTPEPPDQR